MSKKKLNKSNKNYVNSVATYWCDSCNWMCRCGCPAYQPALGAADAANRSTSGSAMMITYVR